MNYQRIHNQLIERARHRILDIYTEQHHVVPRCLGGSNAANNLVRLTPEEHYCIHQLLVKLYPGNASLVSAAYMMTRGSRGVVRTNKMYGWLKRKHAEAMHRHQAGMKNSNAGRMWVSHMTEQRSFTIAKDDPLPDGCVVGRNRWKPTYHKKRYGPGQNPASWTLRYTRKDTRRKCRIDGFEYPSAVDAGRVLGIRGNVVDYRLKSSGFPNYQYVGE